MNTPDYLLRVLERLDKVRPTGTDKYEAQCPAHEARKESLSIGIGDNSAVLLHCFAGCALEAICSAIQLTPADLFPPKDQQGTSPATRNLEPRTRNSETVPKFTAPKRELGQIVATYNYTDEDGKLLYQCLRFEPKDFRQRQPDGAGGWVWTLKGVRRVLYQLPALIRAIEARERIFLCEGEKDVHRLQALGLAATCNPMGANKWDPEYTHQLRGAHVYLIPDNDEPGRKHRDLVGEELMGIVAKVCVINLPNLPDHGDVSDWLDAGCTAEQLMQLAEAAPEWEPPDPSDPELGTQNSEQATLELDLEKTEIYFEHEGWLWWNRQARDGQVRQHLANFTARIVAQTIEDNGADVKKTLALKATFNKQTYQFALEGKAFTQMDWVLDEIDSSAWMQPGSSIKDRTRHAIQVLSGRAPLKYIYGHTGWREVGDKWVYLHCDGAVGADLEQDVSVKLDGSLVNYKLPAPSQDPEEVIKAVRASLDLIEVSEKPLLMFPLYASIWRSILDVSDFAIWIAGRTQSGKSSLAALAQAHFGSEWNNRRLPGAWKSTGNALMETAFQAKDALVVLDDYVAKTPLEALKLQEKAETVLRAQGNGAGRGRMRAEGGLRNEHPPRGLIVATAEDLPPGESLRARMVILEMVKGDVDIDRLCVCQKHAADGLYATAMTAYLAWLASDLPAKRQAFKERAALILKQNGTGDLARMPDIISQLIAASEMFYQFAHDAGALTGQERMQIEERSWNSLWRAGMEQQQFLNDQEPANRFVELLRTALLSGKAHLVDETGVQPLDPEVAMACGWQKRQDRSGDYIWVSDGDRLGWITEEYVYILPDPAYNVAIRIGQAGGEGVMLTPRVLWKRCKEAGVLVATDPVRGTTTVRKVLAGQRSEVLWFFREKLI
jgi:hypothetical protein